MTQSSVLSDFMRAHSAAAVGDMSGAVSAMRHAMAKQDWSKKSPAMVMGGWTFYTDERLSYGAVWVDGENKRIVIGRTTWSTISSYGPAINQFFDDMTTGANGMKYVTMDAGKYAEAATQERTQAGAGEIRRKDALLQLEDDVRSLIVQAASLNASEATDGQIRIFFERYRALQEQFEEQARRLAQVETTLNLAGVAVAGLSA